MTKNNNQDKKVPPKFLEAVNAASSDVHDLFVELVSRGVYTGAIKNAFIKAINDYGGVVDATELTDTIEKLNARVAELEAENKRLLEGYEELSEQCEKSHRKSIDEAFGELERDSHGRAFWRIYTKEMREAVEPVARILRNVKGQELWFFGLGALTREQIDRFIKAFSCPS